MKHQEIEEAHVVIGDPPHWLVAYGMSLLLFTMAITIIACFLVKFPDEIQSRIILATQNPPIHIFSKSGGKVNELPVQDNAVVEAGEIIGVIETSGNYLDVLALHEELRIEDVTQLQSSLKQSRYQVGSLQPIYTDLITSLDQYHSFKQFNRYESQISILEVQLKMLSELSRSLENQSAILKEQFTLRIAEMERNELLYKTGAISSSDYERFKLAFLNEKRQMETFRSDLITNRLKLQETRFERAALQKAFDEQLQRRLLDVHERLKQLQAAIEEWKQMYLIVTPIRGKITLRTVKAKNEFINSNEEFAVVEPLYNTGQYIGRAMVNGNNIGKVQAGMRAIIELDSYPHYEYGSIVGTVQEISTIPQDLSYMVKVRFADKIKTTYNREIELTQEMQGNVRIITKNQSLGYRVFNQLKSIFKNNP